MKDLLAPDGVLAAAIPHYEDRPEQRAVSRRIAQALEESRALLVEAGTGTGKTLAYLMPAVLSGKRVVVSTATRALQDQIARSDLPLVRSVVARSFRSVALKGVSNYVCRRRLQAYLPTAPPTLASSIQSWVESTERGDRAEVDWIGEDSPIWAEITTTAEARVGPRCPHFERCFVTTARRTAEDSDIILTNHHLYFADLLLRARSGGSRLLPEHDVVIFDEAHQLEDVATEYFGVRVATDRVSRLLRDVRGIARESSELQRIAVSVEHAAAEFFHAVRLGLRAPEGSGRVVLPPEFFSHQGCRRAWFQLDHLCEELARELEAAGSDEEDARGATAQVGASVATRARQLRDDLATIADRDRPTHAYWAELNGAQVAITSAPVHVGAEIQRHVLAGRALPIFTSATLTVAGSFDFIRDRLGLDRERVDEFAVSSPFDYGRQTLLYLPRDLPEPGPPDARPLGERILELLAITDGGAFVLFTSHRALRDAVAALRDRVPYPLWVQGEESAAGLLDKFRATPSSVLMGTGSFWEGVDVSGDALRLVIMDKLPFAAHTDPLIEARLQRIAERGGDPFEEVQLPQAAIALKQGFGRLIRRRDDRGVVAILDPRIVTRRYGQVFLQTLPPEIRRTSSLEQVRRWWKGEAATVAA
jgi:ATP-dependent DNA helicase DinG